MLGLSERRRGKLPTFNRQDSYSLYIRSKEREAVRKRWKATRDNPGALVLLVAQAWAISTFLAWRALPVPRYALFVLVGLLWIVQRQRGGAMCLAGCTTHTQQQHVSYWILNRAERKGLNMSLPQDREWVAKREWRWRWFLFVALCPFHHKRVDKARFWARLRKRHGGHLANVVFVLVCRARQVAFVCGTVTATQWGIAHLTLGVR